MKPFTSSLPFAILALACAACAASPVPSGSPAAPPGAPATAPAESVREEDGRSVQEAQAQIAEARRALFASPVPGSPGAGAAASQAEPASPPAAADAPSKKAGAPASRPAPRRASPQPGASDSDGRGDADLCRAPCRAIASMRRAVQTLCRLVSDADPRCTEAARTLEESEARVRPCGC